jgi:hypothetical protein
VFLDTYFDCILERSGQKEERCRVQKSLLSEQDERIFKSSLAPPEKKYKNSFYFHLD